MGRSDRILLVAFDFLCLRMFATHLALQAKQIIFLSETASLRWPGELYSFHQSTVGISSSSKHTAAHE